MKYPSGNETKSMPVYKFFIAAGEVFAVTTNIYPSGRKGGYKVSHFLSGLSVPIKIDRGMIKRVDYSHYGARMISVPFNDDPRTIKEAVEYGKRILNTPKMKKLVIKALETLNKEDLNELTEDILNAAYQS